ncbi:MAG TPA: methyltransferase domain-containing protein [Arenicellales bacterium]|nr:methyltransferase domain-containing protein [Arenicellales bacterium]
MTTVNPIPSPDTSHGLPGVSAAEVDAAMAYETIFVPALFQHWPEHVIAAAGVGPGHRTLDVACGTGVLTRALPSVVGEIPAPVGLDIAPGMLEVARRLNPDIQWRHGDAVALPFEDASFDRVLCQYGLMFFPDRAVALREMSRVLAAGGRLAVAVWDSLENNPGFLEKVDILDEAGGRAAGDALRAPFCLGDCEALHQLAEEAGLRGVKITTRSGEARFSSMHEFVEAEVRGWLPVMGVQLSEEQIETVHAECRRRLRRFETRAGGELVLNTSAHILSASV